MRRWISWLDHEIAVLYPGGFAVVMATGIISNALWIEQYRSVSDALLLVAVIAFPTLIIFTALRMARHFAALWQDLISPRSVFSFFTVVAASDVLGVAMNLRGLATIALLLWLFALTTWTILIYFRFGVLTFLNSAHGANVVHGGWLIAIVGTESLVVLGAAVAPPLGEAARSVFVLLHLLWGVGLGLYGIFIALFAYRIFFFDVEPDDVTPLLWVVMGAAAISTNAGSTLILTESGIPFLLSMRAVHRRRHLAHVGLGDVVDSFAAAVWILEAHHPKGAGRLHPHAVEPCVSAGHVRTGVATPFTGLGIHPTAHCGRSHGLDRSCRVGDNRSQFRHSLVAQLCET